MAYSTISKPSLHFNTKLYTGDGATSTAGTLARTISGVGFQPDFTWVKGRTSGNYDSHGLHDAVRTAPKWLRSDNTDLEYDVRTGFGSGGVGSFTSDGFGIFSGSSGTSNNYNNNTTTYVAWNWKAGNSAGSSNSDGSITSTVSVNTTAGFSIVTYTGTGSAGTVGHGLGAVPKWYFVKRRDAGSSNWHVYHAGIAATKDIRLNIAEAAFTTDIWNDTAPTSTVFNVKTSVDVNASSGTYIAYCFAEKKGYSKFGTYTGNGNADGTFVFCGFRPAWVMFKGISGTTNWQILDNKRNTFNSVNKHLRANSNIAEFTNYPVDFLSNGFKIRNTDGDANTSGSTYIYMAFAEEPLVANVGASIPATAR